MSSVGKLSKYGIMAFSWLVKAAGVALLLLVLAIAIGEGPPNPFKLKARELFLMISLIIALAGIVLALWRQLIGGIFMVTGMVPFYITGVDWRRGWVFHTFVLIGFLSILCWWLKKLREKRTGFKK